MIENLGHNPVREFKAPDFAGAYAAAIYTHPDDVVSDRSLTIAEKRALLASWISDARAVENAPALRRIDGGFVVEVEAIRRALNSLDAAGTGRIDQGGFVSRSRRDDPVFARWLNKVGRFNKSTDDDDDPPPAPAGCGIPFRPKPPVGTEALQLVAA